MFGSVTKFFEEAKQQVQESIDKSKLFTLEEGYNEEEEDSATAEVSDKARIGSGEEELSSKAMEQLVAFPAVPAKWEAKKHVWEILLHHLIEVDPNTYCVTPARILSSKREDLDSRGIFTLAENLEKVTSMPDFDAPPSFMQEIINNRKDAENLRFDIVPRVVSEARFWRNLSWRYLMYVQATNTVEDIVFLVNTLQVEPSETHSTSAKNFGICNEAIRTHWNDELISADLASRWLTEKCDTVKEEVSSAVNSYQLLDCVVQKKEVSEFGDSLWESCKYRKTKITSILSELSEHAGSPKLVGTPLEYEKGTVFVELLEVNELLHKIVASYAELVTQQHQSDAEGKDGTPTASIVGSSVLGCPEDSNDNKDTSCSSKHHHSNTDEENLSHHCIAPVTDMQTNDDDDDDAVFEADLPWDEEDDE